MKNRYEYEQPFNLHSTIGTTQVVYNISALCDGLSPPSKQQSHVFDPLRLFPLGYLTQGSLFRFLVSAFPSTLLMVSHGERDLLLGWMYYMRWLQLANAYHLP